MRPRSLILDVATRVAFHTVVVFALYLLFAGHNRPGGGFAGGLVAGAGLVLRYAGGGAESVRRTLPATPESLLAAGLLLAGLVGAGGWLWGDGFLGSESVEGTLGPFGTVKLVSVLGFDVGVFLVVLGIVAGLLVTLGGEAGGEAGDEEAAP